MVAHAINCIMFLSRDKISFFFFFTTCIFNRRVEKVAHAIIACASAVNPLAIFSINEQRNCLYSGTCNVLFLHAAFGAQQLFFIQRGDEYTPLARAIYSALLFIFVPALKRVKNGWFYHLHHVLVSKCTPRFVVEKCIYKKVYVL